MLLCAPGPTGPSLSAGLSSAPRQNGARPQLACRVLGPFPTLHSSSFPGSTTIGPAHRICHKRGHRLTAGDFGPWLTRITLGFLGGTALGTEIRLWLLLTCRRELCSGGGSLARGLERVVTTLPRSLCTRPVPEAVRWPFPDSFCGRRYKNPVTAGLGGHSGPLPMATRVSSM